MERENYIEKLMRLSSKGEPKPKPPRFESLAIDTDLDKGTQTNRGFWIDETSIPLSHRSFGRGRPDASEQIQKQVQLVGCVNAQRSDLIPDGCGGYFVHITKKDIQRREPPPPQLPPTNMPPNHGMRQRPFPNKHSSHQFGTRPPFQRGPFVPPRSYHSHDNPMFMGNSLPLSSNNLTEDLLRMQHNNPNKRGKWPNQRF